MTAMGNHCVPTVCRECGHEYCVRCEAGICPKCGTPWDAKPVSPDDYIRMMKGGPDKMSIEEIYRAACLLGKTDKMKLVNMILGSITEKKPRQEMTDGSTPTFPVHQAMRVFDSFVKKSKGISYSPNGLYKNLDYKHMRELLEKLEERMVESGVVLIDDEKRIETLRSFLHAVREMRNTWYFDNRFTPAGLNTDFEKIYIALKTQRNHGQPAAFDYL